MRKAEVLKINVMCYWRFHRLCPIVAMEYNWHDYDVLAVTSSGMVIETEVKTNLRDMKRDLKKPKHWGMKRNYDYTQGTEALDPYIPDAGLRVHYFYFAVPEKMEDGALELLKELYPYAGLLVVRPNDFYQWDNYHHIEAPVSEVYHPHRFTKPKLEQKEIDHIVSGLSATACRMAFELLARDRHKGESHVYRG
jgi:hypothetical protein